MKSITTNARPPETSKYSRVMALGTIAKSVRRARHETSAALTAWGMTDLAPDAILVVSEMVTNALNAVWKNGTFLPVLMRLRSDDGVWLIIETWDAAVDEVPSFREHLPDAENGRGLEIITSLSHSFGYCYERNGKVVWSVLGPT